MIIELLAVITTLICVWLTIKRHIWSWPIGIIAVILYSIVFWKTKLYSDFGLQFIFLIQSIIGWITWKNHLEDKYHTRVEVLSGIGRLFYITTGIGLYVVLAFIMKEYTNASVPWVDSFVAVFSLIANWLLAKRKIESWIIWILVDIIYIGLFIYKGLYFSAGLYYILLLMALQGFKKWSYKIDEKMVK
jgi:nicotinamide mononucleotide transporter